MTSGVSYLHGSILRLIPGLVLVLGIFVTVVVIAEKRWQTDPKIVPVTRVAVKLKPAQNNLN